MKPLEYREIARKLYAHGLRQYEIAQVLGVSAVSISLWLDPIAYERNLQSNSERKQAKKAVSA
jgi:uncharacterized protein YjcR